MKTFVAKPYEVDRKWYVIDVAGVPLGRAASQIAMILRGKHKPTFTPHVDCGDYVIVVNIDKVQLTGNKANQKLYRHHTLYPGGLREVPFKQMLAKRPERIMELAVKGMLPKNSLGRAMIKKLKVYAGPEHNHQAQQPEVYEIKL